MTRDVATRQAGALPLPQTNRLLALLSALLIALFVFLGFEQIRAPAPAPASAPASEFSAARAWEHLEVIAQEPHLLGTAAHSRVRDYLVQELEAMGLEPEVQTTTVVDKFSPDKGFYYVATTQNILVRLEGSADSDRAILLDAHYDSTAFSPGASDNGVAVVALLEVLRALQTGEPLQNDVIVLFSDGEELALMGAQAFVAEHPWADDVALAINLEARGNTGPSILFETNPDNAWLVAAFAQSAPYPLGNSLAYEVYKTLPNNSDFSILKERYPGLNFAFFKGLVHYHHELDNLASADPRSLQHKGANVLGLVRHFGDVDLEAPRSGGAVYFNLARSLLVHYPYALVLPLTLLVLLLFVGVMGLGFRRGRLSVRGVGLGVLALLLGLVAALGVAYALWQVVLLLNPGYAWSLRDQGDLYSSDEYVIGFLALTTAAVAAIYNGFRSRTSLPNLMAGAQVVWLLLLLGVSVAYAGASYLFVWPLLFNLLALGWLLYTPEQDTLTLSQWGVLAVGALPALLLILPTIALLFMALGVTSVVTLSAVLALLLGLLVPHLTALALPGRWLLPGLAALVGVVFLVLGTVSGGFNAAQPKPNSLVYALDPAAGEALWLTTDRQTDEWTAQYLTASPANESLAEFLPDTYTRRTYLQAPAPPTELPTTTVEVLSDETADDVRTVRLSIDAVEESVYLVVFLYGGNIPLLGAEINGKPVDTEISTTEVTWGISYSGPAEPFELTLRLRPSDPLVLRLVDQTLGLPESIPDMEVPERPDAMTERQAGFGSSTIVGTTFTLDAQP